MRRLLLPVSRRSECTSGHTVAPMFVLRSMTLPREGAMHRPGEASEEISSDTDILGKETWDQFATKMRHGRRRIRVIEITAKMSYEYQMLKKLCRKRPNMRQWALRDNFCDMSPGVVMMSPSMQAAFMKIFRLKDKGSIRKCLRDIIPIIEYRNREEKQVSRDPDALIPEGHPETLNQKKRELYERKSVGDNKQPLYLNDNTAQAKLRRKIRQRLLKFQRQLAVSNAIASRTVMYNEDDAIGYFLFRGPAMYAGLHRVFFELSKLMPHFVPRTMLDFGSGTGTAILVAKEVYDPGALAFPLYRNLRTSLSGAKSAKAAQLEELRYDLKRLERNNDAKKRARFVAVAALIENGEVDLNALPEDLRKEIVAVAKQAAVNKRDRMRRESHARNRELVDGNEWIDDDALGKQKATTEDLEGAALPGEDGTDADAADPAARSWWERLVDSEVQTNDERVAKRLQPLQEVVAIEPSPGMMEIGVHVLHDDVPNVTWKRYLMQEDETIQHDLVVAAYTLSEIADEEQRTQLVKQLWSMTKGVLVLVDFASLTNFDMMMKARDTILAEKDVGLWDWQPTIVAPCPHEKRCPLRHSKFGVKHKKARVCNSNVLYRSTFVEVWARHLPLKVSIEPITYMVFARNEMMPHRIEERKRQVEAAARREVADREAKQRELYEASLSLKDVVFDRLSDEALHVPSSDVPPPLPRLGGSDEVTPVGPSPPTEGAKEVADIVGDTSATVIRTSNKTISLMKFPKSEAAPQHKFNRAYVDAGFQRTRPISPQEMLTVRSEVSETTQRFWKAYPSYYRIVADPSCRGKILVNLCTPDGELMRGRVYRRFYGDSSKSGGYKHYSMRWQHIGGWRLLRRVKRGSLFPSDVPLYTVSYAPQVDFPTTLLDRKASLVQKTAMQLNDPMNLMDTPDGDLTVEDVKLKRAAQFERDRLEKVNDQMHTLFGASHDTKLGEAQRIDAKVEISTDQWHDAVRRAKQRVVSHSKKALPNAAKLRDATKKFRSRAKYEAKMNRERRR